MKQPCLWEWLKEKILINGAGLIQAGNRGTRGITLTVQSNRDAEQGVLGAMFLDREAIAIAIERLTSDDFFFAANRILYEVILSLYDRTLPVAPNTLTDELNKRGKLEDVGGLPYVYEIAGSVPTAYHVESDCQLVRERSELRQLQGVSNLIAEETAEYQGETDDLLDRVETRLMSIRDARAKTSTVRIRDLTRPVMDDLEFRVKNKGGMVGLATGFYDLDNLLGGLEPGHFCIIGGRTSHGKTAFALSVALQVAKPTLIFSLEMSARQLYQRCMSMLSGVPLWRIRRAVLDSQEMDRLAQDEKRIYNQPVFINDKAALSILELRAIARRYKQREDIKLVIVDYLQLVYGGKAESRRMEITNISRGLKALTKEIGVPVIALSQLSRAGEQRPDKKPTNSDLYESSALECDADQVIFVYRPGQSGEKIQVPGQRESINVPLTEAEILLTKNRHGATGETSLYFDCETTLFKNSAGREQ